MSVKIKHSPSIHSDYLGCAFDQSRMRRYLKQAASELQQFEFDAIAFRGISGALVAPILAHLMDKSLIVVRKKPDEPSHSFSRVEGDKAALRYLLVDDFTSNQGATIKAILGDVHKFNPQIKCIGMHFYHNSASTGLPIQVTQYALSLTAEHQSFFETPPQKDIGINPNWVYTSPLTKEEIKTSF